MLMTSERWLANFEISNIIKYWFCHKHYYYYILPSGNLALRLWYLHSFKQETISMTNAQSISLEFVGMVRWIGGSYSHNTELFKVSLTISNRKSFRFFHQLDWITKSSDSIFRNSILSILLAALIRLLGPFGPLQIKMVSLKY